ncbi:IclR family transcriptional regulator [Halogeometricum sp. CBA1124]|uniref:IclR family transcriptional regulator n=1 Tax=Halogeometricum sp. CBA1124 TaxID=2668071 RepID=UPI00142AA6C6|nr:IclR family transcriptional regulator [Halogeometricum sp. CBA1124]MUV57285.1 helix-turn-helix domain-containing protein [Halogeometricum sp. CBA1124]
MSYEAKNPVQATQRSLDIIEALRELNGARLTTLSEELDIPNSTVHSHLSTMMERGYVVKEGDVYRISLRFLELGEYTRSIRKVYTVTKPEVNELAEETGEVVSLLIEEAGKGVVLHTEKGPGAVPLDIDPGKHVHLHTSALGKAVLAYLPNDRVETIIDRHGLPTYTEQTITDREQLSTELSEIREQSLAFDREERVAGTSSVAVPIRTEDGRIIGSVGMSGPTSRLSEDRINSALVEALHDVTNIVELKLTYS